MDGNGGKQLGMILAGLEKRVVRNIKGAEVALGSVIVVDLILGEEQEMIEGGSADTGEEFFEVKFVEVRVRGAHGNADDPTHHFAEAAVPEGGEANPAAVPFQTVADEVDMTIVAWWVHGRRLWESASEEREFAFAETFSEMVVGVECKLPLATRVNADYWHGLPLNQTRSPLGLKSLIVLLSLLAWVVLSNHCALAGLLGAGGGESLTGNPAVAGCCHRKAVPQPQSPAGDEQRGMGCCRSLHVTLPEDLARISSAPLVEIIPLGEVVPVLTVDRSLSSFGGGEVCSFPSGPPIRVRSFCERVLQSSLPSTAPPQRLEHPGCSSGSLATPPFVRTEAR